MIHASAKTVFRLAIALGAFAWLALAAMPDAPRTAADSGAGATAAIPKGDSDIASDYAPDIPPDSERLAAVPSDDGGVADGGLDDISPGLFGGAKKRAPVYANLAASLENAAVLAAAGADDIGVDADKTIDLVADAVAKTPLNDGATAVAVAVYAESDISDAMRFLKSRNVEVDYAGETWLEAYVPAHLLGELSERAGVISAQPVIPPSAPPAPAKAVVETTTAASCRATDLGTVAGGASVARNGGWTSSCQSSARSGRMARFYTFSVGSTANMRIDLSSADRDSFMYLRAGNGTLSGNYIEKDDDDGSGNDARITRSLATGTYTVEATTYAAQAAGEFTLTVQNLEAAAAPPAESCSAESLGALAAGASLTQKGTWTSACQSTARSGKLARFYTFSVGATSTVRIERVMRELLPPPPSSFFSM